MSNHILVVDDEIGIRELLSEILRDEGYQVRLAANAQEARVRRHEERPDMVLLDIWMPEMDGITLLKEWSATGQLTMPVVMMSGHATVDTAVEATRIGAFDFLEKPIALPKLLATVERAMLRSNASLLKNLSSLQLGRSAQMTELRRRLDQMSSHGSPILLVGESGCGSELVARHFLQPNMPWFAPTEVRWLAENPYQPLTECQGGVIYLADIEGFNSAELRGLGHLLSKLEKHHIRLVCSSSLSASALINECRMPIDLINRISALSLTIPPLKAHSEDIPEIASTFLNRMMESGECPVRSFSTGALNALRQMPWPGNLPMLANAVRTLALSASGMEITVGDACALMSELNESSAASPGQTVSLDFRLPLRQARDQFEQLYFEYHIQQESGNMSRVAEKVGLERTHLYRKLKQLGIR